MKIHVRRVALVSCITSALTCSAALAQEGNVTAALIQKSWHANFQEFFDMLALPDDSINAEDIRKNADWLETAFRKRGFATKQLANDGKPLVFAEYARHVAGAKTILFYMHSTGSPCCRSSGRRRALGSRHSRHAMLVASGKKLIVAGWRARKSTRIGASLHVRRPMTKGRS